MTSLQNFYEDDVKWQNNKNQGIIILKNRESIARLFEFKTCLYYLLAVWL